MTADADASAGYHVCIHNMTEWKKKLLKEFSLSTHLDVSFFDRYDNVLYQYPVKEQERGQTKWQESAAKAIENLIQHMPEQKYATAAYESSSEAFCCACYFDESLPELGKVVLGPYTHDVEKAEAYQYLPDFAVESTVRFLYQFIRRCSYNTEMYDRFDQSVSYHFVRISRYIEANINQNITLDMLADNLNLSKPYLCTIVKKTTNYTVSQYIAKVRINKAKILFWNGFKDMHEVSLILGYKSQAYFSRQFKMFEGVTPIQYMRSYNDDKYVKEKYL